MVTLRDNIVKGNSASGGGGLVATAGTIVLSGNTFEANKGIVVRVEGAEARLTGNTFKNNPSETVVALFQSTASLRNNTFQDNSGRGLYFGATGEIIQNSFRNNRGGGVRLGSWDLDFSGNVLQGNSAHFGGGLYIQGHTSATIHDNIFTGNSATQGGGFFIDGVPTISPPAITLSHNLFEGNSATESGGGGVAAMGTYTITGNIFEGNTSGGSGGGLVLNPAGFGGVASATLLGNTFRRNSAAQGGGLKIGGRNITMGENLILANSASSSGSGIYFKDTTIRAKNDIIANNVTSWEAVHLSDSTLNARHWTLADNGNYALSTAGSSTAILSNTLVAYQDLAGLWGPGISADHTLFAATGISCGGGASCTNSLTGNPRFINPGSGDYHIGPDSACLLYTSDAADDN